MASLLKGALVAQAILDKCTADVCALKDKNIFPTLAILRVGERDDDLAYERGAIKRCKEAGVTVQSVVLPLDIDQSAMMQVINGLNNDDAVHGILMLRPLPKQLEEHVCCEAIDPLKDVDAATTTSLASVFTGSDIGFAPCTAQACIEILRHYNIELAGMRAAIIGRSLVIGKPVAMMLLAENATPTICHTKTQNMASITKEADIVVVATGRMESIGAEYFKKGQTVIDVGISWNCDKEKLCGDVIFDEAEPIVAAITPVPGGVGSVTTAVLVSHVVEAASKQAK